MALMRILDKESREYAKGMIAQNSEEKKLLSTPLVDYLTVDGCSNATEEVRKVAQTIMEICGEEQVDSGVLMPAIALALFSTAADLYEGYPAEDGLLH